MAWSVGARNLVLEQRLRIRAVTTKAVWLVALSYDGEEHEVRVMREDGTYGCVCEHGSVWRFNRASPGICYHAEACYALFDHLCKKPGNLLKYLTENDGGPMDAELRLSFLSFLSSEFGTWRPMVFAQLGMPV